MKTKTAFSFLTLLIFLSIQAGHSQVENLSSLSIKEIMEDDFIGNSPGRIQWSSDSKTVFFDWDPENKGSSSPYRLDLNTLKPEQADRQEMQEALPERKTLNRDESLELIARGGEISIVKTRDQDTLTAISMANRISSASFSHSGKKVSFLIDRDLYWWDIESGQFRQLTNFQEKKAEREEGGESEETSRNDQDEWLFQQQKVLFPKLSSSGRRSFGRYNRGQFGRQGGGQAGPSPVYLDGYSVYNTQLCPDEKHVIFFLTKQGERPQGTKMPVYVTSSGYTEFQDTRSKVGNQPGEMKLGILDIDKDSVYYLDNSYIPGIFDLPDFAKDYPERYDGKDPVERPVYFRGPYWSPDGKYCVVSASSSDNKDNWILLLDINTADIRLLDRQRDEAWVGYGGIEGWMPDNRRLCYTSEETGYNHLYWVNVVSGEKKQLTGGNFEVGSPFMSKSKKYWYFSSNEVHPGEKHFYRMPLEGGPRVQITGMTGSNSVDLSPDEKTLAITYSFANRPPELYIQENKAGAEPVMITDSRSESFKSYNWRVPGFITFEAGDGATVHARLYQPEDDVKNNAAVIFVHGAGYLQNAHKWWSTYYHEYMFHNILADNGYTVLDIDYRGSAGYGRDWRTGIYRHMGGKDLSDNVDGAKYLVREHGIDPQSIGIYGGSYGGFITLMAMFNAPDVFTAGAALRSVTDWAHYNHGYTANILNTPAEDSLAYVRSSPIYFAEGLEGHLLMCHGMMDDNVHYQDIVRLTQRLIDLGKENWELASYPLQRHSFTDPDAWTDEYRRIFKLFQKVLNDKK